MEEPTRGEGAEGLLVGLSEVMETSLRECQQVLDLL